MLVCSSLRVLVVSSFPIRQQSTYRNSPHAIIFLLRNRSAAKATLEELPVPFGLWTWLYRVWWFYRPLEASPSVPTDRTAHTHSHGAKRLLPALEGGRSEEHTSELQSLMRISYAVFCLKNKK